MIAEGVLHLSHSMDCAKTQYDGQRTFIFEHPFNATSWRQHCVHRVRSLPGIYCITIDMCYFGLRSKVHRRPMRKRTRIMTNSRLVADGLQGCLCPRNHDHQVIEGSEGGVRRSAWAQVYPPAFVEKLAQLAVQLAARQRS